MGRVEDGVRIWVYKMDVVMLGGASVGRVGWGDGRVLVAGVAVDGMVWVLFRREWVGLVHGVGLGYGGLKWGGFR